MVDILCEIVGKSLLLVAGRHWVVPASAPGITAQYAPYSQPYSFDDSVGLHGLNEVCRATGLKSATAVWSTKYMQRFADASLVEQYRQDDESFQHPGLVQLVKCFRLSRRLKSFSSSL